MADEEGFSREKMVSRLARFANNAQTQARRTRFTSSSFLFFLIYMYTFVSRIPLYLYNTSTVSLFYVHSVEYLRRRGSFYYSALAIVIRGVLAASKQFCVQILFFFVIQLH